MKEIKGYENKSKSFFKLFTYAKLPESEDRTQNLQWMKTRA